MRTAYDANGTDWITLVIPPENDKEAEYVIRFDASFLMSNWGCIFGQGCPGQFGDQDSHIAPDMGCCGDSFYLNDKEDEEHVQSMFNQLQAEDWDEDLRKHVAKHGWLHKFKDDDDDYRAKGKVFQGGCVFQNRSDGSVGAPGCAFHRMAQRTDQDHVDVMPSVCWMLPLRFNEVEENIYELGAWTVDQWHTDSYPFVDFRFSHRWWCIDSPEAYSGDKMLYRTMERELRKVIGDRPYELIAQALEARIAQGWKPMPMPGAVVNEGRPLLPLLVGNRTPKREPTDYPDILAKMKEQADGDTTD